MPIYTSRRRYRAAEWHILLNKFHPKINELNRQNAPSPLIRFAIGALFFCLTLVSRHIQRNYKSLMRSCDIDLYAETLSMEIEDYQEKDYTEVDNTIFRLGLTTAEQETLNCYMGGMSCKEIAEFLTIDRVTVWRRRQRVQLKYKTLFH